MSQDTPVEDREAEASARLAEVFDASVIDALLADAMASGTPIEGVDGLWNKMTKAVLERCGVPNRSSTSCDLGIFVDQPAEPIATSEVRVGR